MKKNLIWFRNDLRLYDHTALHEACKSDTDKVIALFIATPEEWKKHYISEKKISFMYYNLISLEKDLLKLNIILHYHESTNFLKSIQYLMYFCFKHKINNLFYHYQYEFDERNRDFLVKKKLSQQGVFVQGFHDNLLVSHELIKNKNNKAYKVFSFFKKKITQYLYKNKIPECFSIPLKRKPDENYCFFNSVSSEKLDFKFDKKIFPVGEIEAFNRLKNFCIYKVNDYSLERNFPFLNSTSMLSPYLSIGIISSRHCLSMFLKTKINISLNNFFNSSWINQILWREFYYHLLISFPKLSKNQALVEWENRIDWNNNIKHFNAWKEGNTGFPIVDAGMRQLNELGWMHNRVRMITSNFLVKNLFIDWRMGEKYFMSHLIDGDLALNNGGWQWSASIGTDSVPYIRILNPLNQSKKFDISGVFIKKFIPELRNVPNEYIHQPHEWSKKMKCKIDYPDPIINYDDSRKRTLLIFKRVRSYFKKGLNTHE
ncbi:deoxyribodipyrimidine photo-lyase [Buchnera aphidicola]|uniref:Deoxyribodipyrimidine photo-lyase n=1 Tax=Buchnera aphidicola str. USDA (Myzus persicae) TaxID=1009856 RepID=W0P4T9_BUCMP|nr:deoxyribodipyrimidine photo-lyase [Buchnera aphidicola]AHG60083.1 Phrb [Buchnera aphidicola str. USDA (Myzus persicae)]AHG60663.1 Phrb [Buchnera aphidicola str. W106 (Myzus persicae)]AHG61235.1 Phrb [Buchnera aphidicola str. G002 (Myzus persicae)]AHG61808.1 Phrb [Buchnera aphidicola str. F009 (Myzus persicae)]WAI03230.1 MAG: deoxyribodipyrimidine photo-lyase [Buchnera aphidicola (Myzus persicae)]